MCVAALVWVKKNDLGMQAMPTSGDQLLTLAQDLFNFDSARLADWDFGYIKS